MEIERDKKLHFFVAFFSTLVMDLILFYFLKTGVADLVTMICGISAIVAWEFIPGRHFEIKDIYFGFLGLVSGLVMQKIFLALFSLL